MFRISVVNIAICLFTVHAYAFEKHTEYTPADAYKTSCFKRIKRNPLRLKNAHHFTGIPTGLSRTTFDSVIDRIESIYTKRFRRRGLRLEIKRLWDVEDAYATTKIDRTDAKTRIIQITGGFARHEMMTADAFALLLCHEIGHHFGGAPIPIETRDHFGELAYISGEGQADYFATLKCMRRVFADDDNSDFLNEESVPKKILKNCRRFSESKNMAICSRSQVASLALSSLVADNEGKTVSLYRRDRERVDITNHDYPELTQCRLDTFIQGSICKAPLDMDTSITDPNIGLCSRHNGVYIGARPLCWYQPYEERRLMMTLADL